MRVINYTELRLNLKKWFDLVVDDFEELIIKRKTGKDLVLISFDEYRSLKETQYLMSGKNREFLLKSLEEAKQGDTQVNALITE
jgi:antitoxin YefM